MAHDAEACVPDHLTPLQMGDERFETLMQRLEAAFRVSAAAFYYRQAEGPTLIHVFDPAAAGWSDGELQEFTPALGHLDRLLVFAFEDAPDDAISSWAERHEQGYGPIAVARVERMRSLLTVTRTEWQLRMHGSGGRILGDLETQVMLNPTWLRWQALLRMDSFVTGSPFRRGPVGSSREWLTAILTKNEILRLINVLERTRDLMPDLDDESRDEGGDGA